MPVFNGCVHIERIDPPDLDLDTADEIAKVDAASIAASIAAAGPALPAPVGPTRMLTLQLGSDGRPSAALWIAREPGGPVIAHQEDTSVLRAHRGRRLGLRMKLDMLRWIADERPEVATIDTWNATTNHHMITVNERLGARVVEHHVGFGLERLS